MQQVKGEWIKVVTKVKHILERKIYRQKNPQLGLLRIERQKGFVPSGRKKEREFSVST